MGRIRPRLHSLVSLSVPYLSFPDFLRKHTYMGLGEVKRVWVSTDSVVEACGKMLSNPAVSLVKPLYGFPIHWKQCHSAGNLLVTRYQTQSFVPRLEPRGRKLHRGSSAAVNRGPPLLSGTVFNYFGKSLLLDCETDRGVVRLEA